MSDDTRIFDLPELLATAPGDLFVVVDVDDTTGNADGTTKEITSTNLFGNIPSAVSISEVNASVDTVTDLLNVQSESSGTPAAGIGVGLTFSTETAVGNVEIGGAIRSIITDVDPTNEDFALVFFTMLSGNTATERMRIASSGNVGIGLTNPDNFGGDLNVRDSIQIISASTGQITTLKADDNGDFTLKSFRSTGASLIFQTSDTGGTPQTAFTINSSQNATFAAAVEIDGALNHDGTTAGFYGTTPATQPAHIVDADGTLADITTKFNTLLAQIAALGLQASS